MLLPTRDIRLRILERVLRYWTVRDKFNGVVETLGNIGVKRVDVKQDGLLFVIDNLIF